MKTAREMFEDLGYKYHFYEDICEKRKKHKNYAHIFSKDWLDIWFVLKSREIEIVNYDNTNLSMQELKAINQMVKELGWLDD